MNSNTKILVTGGAGFIGSHIVDKLLSLGYHVTCLDNFTSGKIENIYKHLNNNSFKLIVGDIRNLKTCLNACKGIDKVIHLAAIGNVPRSILKPLLYQEVNVIGTLNIFEASRKNKIKLVVYASSSSVYGDLESLPKVESEIGLPQSPYAESKLSVERYAKLYFTCYKLRTIGLRYFNVFGPRQSADGDYAAVIPKFIKLIKENKKILINGSKEISRDFTFVENVVCANLLALEQGENLDCEVMNVGCGKSITLLELYTEIKNQLNSSSTFTIGEYRRGDIEHSLASLEKVSNVLGYRPVVSFEEGIKRTLLY
jgi:NAD dependent epimerase